MDLLKLIFFTFLIFQAIHANDCPSRYCGDNPFVIRFPFHLEEEQTNHCGYPGFDLSCVSEKVKVVINLPYSGDFWIRDINYLMQEIQLYDPNGCLPRRLLSLNLSSSPFMASYSQNFTFISCPSEVVRSRLPAIDCLSNSTISVLATSSMNFARAMNMCSIIDTLPVPASWPQDDNWLSSHLDGDLNLTWNVPDCEDCEARGGICGFENRTSDQVLCFSDPSTGKSRGLQIFKIIAMSIVIPAITCSICISCFIMMMERRRNSYRATNAAQNSATVAVEPPPPAIPGLDDSTIESYTKVVLGESRRVPGPNGATCPICLIDYHPKDMIRCIPLCEHCFHSDCIDEWLRLNEGNKHQKGCDQNRAINLKCSNQENVPVLNLPSSGDLYVRSINYSSQAIQLYDPNNCLPSLFMNSILSPSPLMAINYQNYTFYNCPLNVTARSNFIAIGCLSNSTFSVLTTSSILRAQKMNNLGCNMIRTVPIPVSSPLQYEYNGFNGDLMLTWRVSNCEVCGNIVKQKYLHPGIVVAIVILVLLLPVLACLAYFLIVEGVSALVKFKRFVKRNLSSLVSRARERSARQAQAASIPSQVRLPVVPAEPRRIDFDSAMNTIVVGESRRVPGPNGITCPICLEDYNPRDTIKCSIKCEHYFHANCIDLWLRTHNSCPICRTAAS
ncbi:hypothetical protein BUALT_Bualt01G0239300 [Buddleja alternifolia]|uniref:RING-type domain-containing protein n=1 Tax=Buddleja alternifolia TaxID=168488 RepID=A0AAV6Y9P3_9LAMI|nr:hypothetical protein BUALT_Bualt01G0239300 [Buddleja alternifolia]